MTNKEVGWGSHATTDGPKDSLHTENITLKESGRVDKGRFVEDPSLTDVGVDEVSEWELNEKNPNEEEVIKSYHSSDALGPEEDRSDVDEDLLKFREAAREERRERRRRQAHVVDQINLGDARIDRGFEGDDEVKDYRNEGRLCRDEQLFASSNPRSEDSREELDPEAERVDIRKISKKGLLWSK